MDTKKTLTLDRKRIRDEEHENIEKIIKDLIDFFLSEIEERLLEERENRSIQAKARISYRTHDIGHHHTDSVGNIDK